MKLRCALLATLTVVMASADVGAQSRIATARPKSASRAAEDLFRQAGRFLEEGSAEKASSEVVKGLKLDPNSAEGNNLLGLIYEQEKQYALATRAFLKALESAPRSAKILTNLGNSYFVQKDLHGAESELRAALRFEPSNASANYSLGVVLLTEHRPQDAIPYFQAVQPPDVSSLFDLVQSYLQAGEAAQGLETANRLSKLAKNDVRVHFTLGVLLAANRQYAAGARELETADALRPGTFEILYNLGQAYLDDNETAKAQSTLERALNLRPQSAETFYLLARTYASQRQDLKALELLVKAHKLAPRNTDVIFLMARLTMKQAYYEDAIPLLKSGLKIAPHRPDLHAALGECYFISGQIPKAIQEFQTLIQLSPSAASYAFMALCYRHLGRFDEAEKYLQLGLKANPRNAACLYNMGYIASRQGHYKEAGAWLEKALRADPHYVDALLQLSSVKMDERKFAEAIPLLHQCAKLDPHPAPVYYKLATAERDLHQMAAAERDMKVFQTLSRDPTPGPYPYQHLFDYLDQRAGLPVQEQSQLDLAQLEQEVKLHPDRPRDLYLLAETYLKIGQPQSAQPVIARLDQVSHGDFRTAVGVGVLLARYGLYSQALARFRAAVEANPNSNDAWYDLGDAYFRARNYPAALAAVQHVSRAGQREPTFLSLRGDIEAHLGRTDDAVRDYRQVIAENPDSDQNYLALALAYLRSGGVVQARQVLAQGLTHTPDSGVLFWGMGVLAAAENKPSEAEQYLNKALDLMPQWPASYSALGFLYYETGQIQKAREILKEFTKNGPRGALDVQNIERVLSAARQKESAFRQPARFSPQARQQFLAMALVLADQTP